MKRFVFSVIGVLFTLCSVAQQNTRAVNGVVFDENDLPMAGVTIKAFGGSNSVATGEDGNFIIMVSPYSKKIVASHELYYESQAEIDGSYIIFRMKPNLEAKENKRKAEEKARLEAEKAEREAFLAKERVRIAKAKAAQKAERERIDAEEKARLEAEKAAKEKASANDKSQVENANESNNLQMPSFEAPNENKTTSYIILASSVLSVLLMIIFI